MVLFSIDSLKEPKGFMKILQFLFAILAFSTTTSFSTEFSFHATPNACNITGNMNVVRQHVSYAFELDGVVVEPQLCESPASHGKFHFQTNTSSDAKFFVAIGVVCMLCSAAALAVYSLLSERYSRSRIMPLVDLILHGIISVMWLAASSAWADGVGTLKDGCNPKVWLDQVCGKQDIECEFKASDSSGSFAKLHISLLLGFLNVFLWASNMWFIYKETPYFKGDQPPPTDVGNIGNI